MRILKIVCTVLLCIGVLLLGAFLPGIVSGVLDTDTGEVSYGVMEPISLDIREMKPLEKLGCFMDNSVVYLPDYQGKTKRAEIPVIVAREMQLYQDAGIVNFEIDFADTLHWYTECALAMCYNIYAPGNYAQFWFVNMSSTVYMESHLQLILDDSTGAILFIDFQTEQPFYSSNIPYSVLQRFYTVYFGRLEVPLEKVNAIEIEPVDLSETSVSVFFGWDDEPYGRMILNFQVYEKGFFVELS